MLRGRQDLDPGLVRSFLQEALTKVVYHATEVEKAKISRFVPDHVEIHLRSGTPVETTVLRQERPSALPEAG